MFLATVFGIPYAIYLLRATDINICVSACVCGLGVLQFTTPFNTFT